MAQPPPRKGAYNKFVQNLHKEQFAKLQAKNQQELDLLDDIRNFMKQKVAIEKHYAEGIVKLSSVYGTKKIANIEDVRDEGEPATPGEHNIYNIWRKMLEENDKIGRARLAAVQVFQENISEDAKLLASKKKSNSKKALDRLAAVQADVQSSISEVDRTKRSYFAEESDAIDVGKKAEDAELKAKGKKRDVISIFQSTTSLKHKAIKLSAKQDESDIKSTGARNDYLLAVETANAHQDRYFHHDLQQTMMDMEFGIYEKMSEYFATLARTELLTCSALQSSYNKLKDQSESVSRDFNYKCYLKTYRCLADHVQYAFEPVEGDTINTITPSEHDDGYSLKYEARTTAAKLNQAVKTIRAFRKRIKACEHHKAAGLKQEPNDAKGPNLDEKIEELVLGIRSAEVDLAKCKARLRKLREGNVEVDSYLDNANLDSLYVESEEARPRTGGDPIQTEWPSSTTQSQAETPAEAVEEEEEAGGGWAEAEGGWSQEQGGQGEDWASGDQWGQQDQTPQQGWNGEADWAGQGQEEEEEEERQDQTRPDIDPQADVWKALVLYTFTANNEDELTVGENEDIFVLVRECDEEGWVMARNQAGGKGYVPSNYIEVYASLAREESEGLQGERREQYSRQSSGQLVKQVSVESNSSWGVPAPPPSMPPIPESGPPLGLTTDEEETDSEDLPPGNTSPLYLFIMISSPCFAGMAPPMGPPPPPTISVHESDNEGGGGRRNSRPVSINFGSSLESVYCRGLYDYPANGPDELSFKEDDVIHIVSRNPNRVDDGWYLGELDGKTGLFPSIVVEECQADGSDWSPDVSVCGSPPAFAPPPCFPPPPATQDLPPPPPAPAPALPPPPQITTTDTEPESELTLTKSKPARPAEKPKTSLVLDAPVAQIMVTNPTPLVENENDPRETETQVSYYVEDNSFSMNMAEEKKEKYQASVPVEVNVVVEPVKPEAEPGLPATEIVVTAPTPRSQSPQEQEPLFTCTSESESEAEGGAALQGEEGEGWASFSDSKPDQAKSEVGGGSDWASFGGETKPAVAASSNGTGEGWAADFSEEKTQSIQEPEPQPEPEPAKKTAAALVRKPSNDAVKKIKIVETETSDDYDSESEIINTNLQVMGDAEATTTDAGPDSSETDSDDRDDESNRKTGRDSSDTESASEPEETSREPSPHIPLPPEQLEPTQLKKLETMKESPA